MAASKQVVLVIVVVTVVATILAAPAPALAVDLVVGDSQGWGLDVDYDDWVNGNDFIVGDTLVFQYAKGQHTVVQATEASFELCNQANSVRMWNSGNDRVTLNTVGQWWFFCGVGEHCEQGMRLNFTVLPVVKLSSSSSSPPALLLAHGGGGVVAAAAGVAAAVIALLL